MASPSVSFAFVKMRLGDAGALGLLHFDRQCGVDDGQAEFRDHFFVFVQNAALEDAKAFLGIVAQGRGPCPLRKISGNRGPPVMRPMAMSSGTRK